MSETSPQERHRGSGMVRQFVLIGILLLLVLALIYDYQVARPGVEQAYDKIAEQSMLVNASSTKTFTNSDVQELIGKEPSRTFEEDNGDLVEVYSWRSGLPIRTHDLFAVYKKNSGKWMFHRHAKFQHEKSTDVSQHDAKGGTVIAAPIDATDLEEPETGPAPGAPSGGGYGGGSGYEGSSAAAPGGGGPGGGGQFDPEAFFNDNDEDGNGVLSGDEIPERMRESLSEIDTDGDESISKEEWNARIEARRASGGGGPRADSGSRRPEPETAAEPESGESAAADDESEADSPQSDPDDAAAADNDGEPTPESSE